MSRTVTIIGGSARAAAQSAVRAGYSVHAADLFADVDLRRLCNARAVTDYPAGLIEILREPHDGGWLYTGALENHPRLIERFSAARPLWGNSAAVLRRVRDPLNVARALREEGLLCPQVMLEPPGDDRFTWLRKPLRSGGGAYITRHDSPITHSNEPATSPNGPWYYQQFIDGESYSAVYLAAGGHSAMLGVTRQLNAVDWTGARDFQYCGSIGPIELPARLHRKFKSIGSALAREFNLIGLFGVDAIINSAGVWPVEINPRYTASIEILERALNLQSLSWHIAACQTSQLPVLDESVVPAPPNKVCGKAILYARDRVTISDDLAPANVGEESWPSLADIPAAGSTIEPGWPILTVLAEAESELALIATLRKHVDEVRQQASR